MSQTICLLITVLKDPQKIKNLELADWDLLIRQARVELLLAHLYIQLFQAKLVECVPEKPLQHLESAYIFSQKQRQTIQFEARKIKQALDPLNIKIIYLKGAAYLLSDTANSKGRLLSDIDILVPENRLKEVELNCFDHGWLQINTNAYDESYYRRWMHEIPALEHRDRATVLDIHHAILPPTTKYKPDPQMLSEQAICVDEEQNIYVLMPADMVLHSAAHLFFESEHMHSLRDIVDLKILIEDFAKDQCFLEHLETRAKELTLERPLFYAIRYCHLILSLNIEENILYTKQGRPNVILLAIMDFLFLRVLSAQHSSCTKHLNGLAKFLLFVRGHYLRMPVYLLLPHLTRKFCMSFFKEKAGA